AEIQALVDGLAESSTAGFQKADLVDALRSKVAEQADTAAALQALVGDLDGIIATLAINDQVPNGLPIAHAGGPYSAAAGGDLALTGAASIDPGGTLDDHDWDLDLDGEFDDASGVSPTAAAPEPGTRLVGLRVTDNSGNQDTAYAVVTVTDGNTVPTITPTPATEGEIEVTVGATQAFSVVVDDADSDPTTVQWYVDGIAAGTGTELELGPFDASGIGVHSVRATVSDGTATRSVDWMPVVLADDVDADDWHANVDCDDADPAVNPGAF